MNWDQIKGQWNQLKGDARKKWAEMTDSDVEEVGGDRDKLVGKLQERYGMAKDEAEREADNWSSKH
ncbi:MAG: CsbD family protein [Paracoccaceae bacterium]